MVRLGVALGLLLAALAANAADSRLDWRTLESRHFRLHFAVGNEALAQRALNIAEAVHARLSPRFAWTPVEPTHIVLTDEYDLANGFASPVPFNHIQLYLTAPDNVRSVSDFDDWYEELITHEYTHTLHLDRAAGWPLWLRKVWGRQMLLFPNLYQPSWLVEGLATWVETDRERGIGRGQSAMYAMAMRAEVAAGIKPFDQVGMSGITDWPGGHVPYLYGVHFYQYLEERYGSAAVERLLAAHSDNLVPFMVNASLAEALGHDGGLLWTDFTRYLQRRYWPELERIREAGVVEGERLTRHGFNTGRPSALADGRVFYLRYLPDRMPRLMLLAPGEPPRELARVHPEARIDAHPRAGVLLAQPELCDSRNLFYDLYRVDSETGERERLTRCGRYRFAAWSPAGDRIAAVRSEGGRSRLDLLDARGQLLETLWQGEDDTLLAQLDWSPDGAQLVVSTWRPGRGWNLELFPLAERRWQALTDDTLIEADPVFSADGRHVLFASEHGGVFNLRRLALDGGRVETLTNVEGGAFVPSQGAPDGPIHYLGYGAGGYDLYRLDAPQPLELVHVAAEPERPEPAPRYGNALWPARDYSPWSSLRPRQWTPLLTLSSERTELGLSTYGQDALGLHSYSAYLGWEFRHELPFAGFGYDYDGRLQLAVVHQNDHFRRDEQLVRVRAVTDWQARLNFPWLGLSRQWVAHLGVGGERGRDRRVWAPAVAAADIDEAWLGLGVSYNDAQRYARGISLADGRSVRLLAEDYDRLGEHYRGQVYSLDWQEYFSPFPGHVLSLRVAIGWGTDRPSPFELGGVATGAADLVNELLLFDRREYPLRGYPEGLPELTGRRMQLTSLEYRLPLLRVERAFTRFPVGLHRLGMSVFAEAGSAWDEGDPDYRASAGVEAIADTNLFYQLNLRARLGIAQGFGDDGESQAYLLLELPL